MLNRQNRAHYVLLQQSALQFRIQAFEAHIVLFVGCAILNYFEPANRPLSEMHMYEPESERKRDKVPFMATKRFQWQDCDQQLSQPAILIHLETCGAADAVTIIYSMFLYFFSFQFLFLLHCILFYKIKFRTLEIKSILHSFWQITEFQLISLNA